MTHPVSHRKRDKQMQDCARQRPRNGDQKPVPYQTITQYPPEIFRRPHPRPEHNAAKGIIFPLVQRADKNIVHGEQAYQRKQSKYADIDNIEHRNCMHPVQFLMRSFCKTLCHQNTPFPVNTLLTALLTARSAMEITERNSPSAVA